MPDGPIRIELGSSAEKPRREPLLEGRLEVVSPRGLGAADRTLIEALTTPVQGRVIVAGSREGAAAMAVARLFPAAEPHLFAMDSFEAHRAREALRRNRVDGVTVHLAADLPGPERFDWVLLAVPRASDAMLSGELLREAHGSLRARGKILAATDNPRDRWLHDRVLEAFGAVTIHARSKQGAAYIARKQPDHAPRPRDFRRAFEARLLDRKLELETRPGVFSHGELDEGTLALSEVAEIGEASRAIDMGCGSGAIGIAAALVASRGIALLADSNARAVEAAHRNVARNGAGGNALVLLTHDFAAVRSSSMDSALANPPYFGDFRIAELFAREAHRVLAPGGRLWLVSKAPERPLEIVRGLFGNGSVTERRGYGVIGARKR